MDIFLCDETIGITQKALRVLRNVLANNIDHELEVWQVDALDGMAYGLIIMDYTKELATVIGDGFRSDGGGEGGAGHRAAQALLAMYGTHPLHSGEYLDYTEDVEDYVALIGSLPRVHPVIPEKQNPQYIDFVIRR